MTAPGQQPTPAPQRPPQVVTAPPKPEMAKPAATHDRSHEDHIDEPGYGHGV
jgi:hypothetical protein